MGAGSDTPVWDEFFSDDPGSSKKVRYPFGILNILDRESRKKIFQEYLYTVYLRKAGMNRLSAGSLQDPKALAVFGLPAGASLSDIKRVFREMAKRFHPDSGGDPEEMIRILDAYDTLSGS